MVTSKLFQKNCDGCSGDICHNLKHVPPMLNLLNLISLDFSRNTMLASTWIESDPALEVYFFVY